MASVRRVRARLENDDSARYAAEALLTSIRGRLNGPPVLDRIQAVFGLSPFECDVLVLCAGIHLDSSFAEHCKGLTHGGAPTFGLALAAFPDGHWSALIPSAPLRWWNLVTVDARAGIAAGALAIDEWVLHILAGVPYLDESLAPHVRPLTTVGSLVPSHQLVSDAIARRWSHSIPHHDVVELSGSARSVKRSIVAAAAARSSVDAFIIDAADIPASGAERAALARTWERTCALFPSILVVETEDDLTASAQAFIRALTVPVVLATRTPASLPDLQLVRFSASMPTSAEQGTALREALAERGASLNGAVEHVSSYFQFDSAQIATVAADLRSRELDDCDAGALWETSRRVARMALDDLATRVESSVGWDDIVLPTMQRTILADIVAEIRGRETVYHRWGFAKKSSRGLGISALFAGASGTGKTLAAEVIANELRIDLYRIDVSATISKYIGETEKHLRRIFDAADRSGAVLLFDEADALFGKRTEVRDSHDRYANIGVSYLLARIEAYRGLAILTTNLKSALDSAFLRRLRFIVNFDFPDAAEREAIWRRAFPAELPLQEIDYAQLARLNIAGGTIRNIALTAAFAAAGSGGPLRMEHLARAARREFIKLDKSFSEIEMASWS